MHVIIVVDVLGAAYSSPFLARLFKLGLGLGGGWIGLPYYGISLMAAFSVALLLFVRLPSYVKYPVPSVGAEGQI